MSSEYLIKMSNDESRIRNSEETQVDEESGQGHSDDAPTYTIDEAVDKVGYGKFQINLTLLAGLGWLTDGCEIFILSIIGDFIACDWTLYVWENAVLTSVVFFGIMLGAPIFGMIADMYGRRRCLGISALLLFIFGALSGISPSFVWMAIFRACMGFALGGIAQSITLCMEFYPSYLRGKAGFYLMYFWSVGSLLVVLISWLIMTYLDSWRVLLVVLALPGLFVVFSIYWYPESARYYLVSGQYDKATKVLMDLSKKNKVDLPDGKLVALRSEIKTGRLRDLFTKKLRRTTLLFWYIWFGNAFLYYGVVLITPLIITQGGLYIASSSDLASHVANLSNAEEVVQCVNYTSENYISLVCTTVAEIPGLLIYTFLAEHISRKVLLSVSSFICGFFVLLLNIDVNYYGILVILFVTRAIITAIFQLVFIITSETYPTPIRALGMGTGSAWARVGGLIVPYVSQVLIAVSPPAALGVMAIVIFLSGTATFFIPFDMRGQFMTDEVIDSKEEIKTNKDKENENEGNKDEEDKDKNNKDEEKASDSKKLDPKDKENDEKTSDSTNSGSSKKTDKDELPNLMNADNSSKVEVVSKNLK